MSFTNQLSWSTDFNLVSSARTHRQLDWKSRNMRNWQTTFSHRTLNISWCWSWFPNFTYSTRNVADFECFLAPFSHVDTHGGGGRRIYFSHIATDSAKGMVLEPFWSEIGYRFWPFRSEIGYCLLTLVSNRAYVLRRSYCYQLLFMSWEVALKPQEFQAPLKYLFGLVWNEV